MKLIIGFLALFSFGISESNKNSVLNVEKRFEIEVSPSVGLNWQVPTYSTNFSNTYKSRTDYFYTGALASLKVSIFSFMKLGILIDYHLIRLSEAPEYEYAAYLKIKDKVSVFHYFDFAPVLLLKTPTKVSIFVEISPALHARLDDYFPNGTGNGGIFYLDFLRLAIGVVVPVNSYFQFGTRLEVSSFFLFNFRPTFSFLF